MPDYLIHLRPTPGHPVPDAIELRRLLKALLRGSGMRAVDVRAVEPRQDDQQAAPDEKSGAMMRLGEYPAELGRQDASGETTTK